MYCSCYHYYLFIFYYSIILALCWFCARGPKFRLLLQACRDASEHIPANCLPHDHDSGFGGLPVLNFLVNPSVLWPKWPSYAGESCFQGAHFCHAYTLLRHQSSRSYPKSHSVGNRRTQQPKHLHRIHKSRIVTKSPSGVNAHETYDTNGNCQAPPSPAPVFRAGLTTSIERSALALPPPLPVKDRRV